jgi:hypothetical protein
MATAEGEQVDWRLKDGRTIKAELRDAWGEGDASMVEFLLPGMKVLTLKRSELHSEDSQRISPTKPGHEDFRFAWATARPAVGVQANQVTITYRFHRTIPGMKSIDLSTLTVAPFKIGNNQIPPDAWKVADRSGSDGVVMEFQTSGNYDASKLNGSKFSATMELEIGKDRRRRSEQIDFPKEPRRELVSSFGDFEITSCYVPPLGEQKPRYVVLVSAEPKEKLIRFLMESNGRTAGITGMDASDAGTFATVKIDYWDRFEKMRISFEGTAGKPDVR